MSYDTEDLDSPFTAAEVAALGKKRIEHAGAERRRSREAFVEEVAGRAEQIARAEAVIVAADELFDLLPDGKKEIDIIGVAIATLKFKLHRDRYRLTLGSPSSSVADHTPFDGQQLEGGPSPKED